MEKAILEKRRTGEASKHEENTLRKSGGQKGWEGGFGFNGVIGSH